MTALIPKIDGPTLFHLVSKRNILLGVSLLSILGCPNERPNVELVLAREAFNAATEVDSAKYAPANFHKAEEAYRKGLQLYQTRSYKDAMKEFRMSRTYAERAELAARIQRQKAGEEGL